MNDLGIIDQFMETFGRYIDSGFGLLAGDVAFLSTILIGIDVTLAGLFWALGGEDNVLGRLIRKVLFVGVFAFILNNFKQLAEIVYGSFSGLGLQAAPGGLQASDLLRPGKIAATGYEAAYPLLEQASDLVGFPEIFGNALTVTVLLLAWFLCLFAFFVLAIQLFITVLEFKLTTLAGFVLVPFALWNRSAFLAERVLGNVVSSGVKVMVLAVVVGIGSTLFSTFTDGLQGAPDLAAAMSQVLGALALLGLGIFGPAIASGLVSGAPQLGAGAALGAGGAAVGATLLAGGAAYAGTRLAAGGGLGAIRAGTAMGSAVSSAYQLGQMGSGLSGTAGVAAGLGGVARAVGGASVQAARMQRDRVTRPLAASAEAGAHGAWRATGGAPMASAHGARSSGSQEFSGSRSAEPVPGWATRLRSDQASRARRHLAVQAIRDGDRPGHGATPSLTDKDE